jgi:hypothetical protein
MVNKLLIPAPLGDHRRPEPSRWRWSLMLQGENHIQNPNPGSRRARLAGAVHRDDRHLDPGTGKFVTVVVARPRRVKVDQALLGPAGAARRSTPTHCYTLCGVAKARIDSVTIY